MKLDIYKLHTYPTLSHAYPKRSSKKSSDKDRTPLYKLENSWKRKKIVAYVKIELVDYFHLLRTPINAKTFRFTFITVIDSTGEV